MTVVVAAVVVVMLLMMIWFFWNRVFLCSLGRPGTSYVDQANLELRDPPIPATRVL